MNQAANDNNALAKMKYKHCLHACLFKNWKDTNFFFLCTIFRFRFNFFFSRLNLDVVVVKWMKQDSMWWFRLTNHFLVYEILCSSDYSYTNMLTHILLRFCVVASAAAAAAMSCALFFVVQLLLCCCLWKYLFFAVAYISSSTNIRKYYTRL